MHPYYKLPEARDRYALSDLLIDFLIFYGKDFNYHSTALSVLNGGQYCVKVWCTCRIVVGCLEVTVRGGLRGVDLIPENERGNEGRLWLRVGHTGRR